MAIWLVSFTLPAERGPLRRFFDRFGFVVIRGALSDAEADATFEEFWTRHAAAGQPPTCRSCQAIGIEKA